MSLFLANKYTNWYMSIVANSKYVEGYGEEHHIIPKSIGGSNSKTNLVNLTAREHYVCHLLLTKMCSDPEHSKKMKFALNRLVNGKSGVVRSKSYELVRLIHAKNMTAVHKGRVKSSEEIRRSAINRTGAKRTEEQRLTISKSLKGRKWSEEHKHNFALARTGKKHAKRTK